MNVLDVILLLVVLLYALSGYWQGFVAGAFATVGLLVGGVLGMWLAPIILDSASPSMAISIAAVGIVVAVSLLGQAALQRVGVKVRSAIRWHPVRAVDALGGSVLSAVAVLIVAWALGAAVTGANIPNVSSLVRDSQVLGGVNALVPQPAQKALRSFDRVVSAQFPRYLDPFANETIVSAAPPPVGIGRDAPIRAAQASVFRVLSNNRCGQGIEGTAFLYAPGYLMTNAHVVAGVSNAHLTVRDNSISVRVVYYNPRLDVAVLYAPQLKGPALFFDQSGRPGSAAAVLGFPENGPYDVQPARIRAQQRLRSPDIYGVSSVIRDVFSIRSKVRPGNSGGPMVSSAGKVLGVVFAASLTDHQTGYVLTSSQVADAAKAGMASQQPVNTGGCA